MKLVLSAVAALALCLALADANLIQGARWKPFEFRGDERYEYKLFVDDGGDAPRENGFVLDIRTKSEEEFDVTWSIRSVVPKAELNEQTILVGWATAAPAAAIMNPMFAMFVDELELKEGEKMSLFGAGTVKVTGTETVGGRSGFKCQFLAKSEGEAEELTWEWTVDPGLALPLKSIVYEDGRVTTRAELVSYEKR